MIYLLFFILLASTLGFLLWPVREHKIFCLIVSLIFFIIASALYGFAGAPQILPLLDAREQRIDELKILMEKHSAMVKADPNDLTAWVALGQDFLETGQWEAAANAFRRAVVLSKGDPKLILAYAKTLILIGGGKVSNDAQKSLGMVVLQDPKNEEARYYLAVKKLQDGKTKEAMQMMKALYHSLPEDSPVRAMIDRQISSP